jgi:hypothetical protein
MDMDRLTSRYLPPRLRRGHLGLTTRGRLLRGRLQRASRHEGGHPASRQGRLLRIPSALRTGTIRCLCQAAGRSSDEEFVGEVPAHGAAHAGSTQKRPAGKGFGPSATGRISGRDRQDSLEGPEKGSRGARGAQDRRARAYFKRIDDLRPEDRPDRIRAELARIEWLLERQKGETLCCSATRPNQMTNNAAPANNISVGIALVSLPPARSAPL